ncbi:MAG: site-specific DNA-methyltransferase [Armatimonadetes bacterium]|nr:site-specific DNA-methyltransferase [Armatimonadota bacterium]MDW8122765.1 site-specific DNA-methyltransferase [Armatimonadota bacterium]
MKAETQWVDRLICGDARVVLQEMPSDFVDLVLTDPPYFFDKLDDEWDLRKVNKRLPSQKVVTHLPPGMKFDPAQGRRFEMWYLAVAKEIFRVLKPGGFFFSFSGPRTYHRMAVAVENAGFWIRDCFIWLYVQNQPKAMGLDHFVERLDVSDDTKSAVMQMLQGWKTPQVKSCFEPILVAQKPYEGTFLENMMKHRVGLFDMRNRVGANMCPANVLTVEPINPYLDKYFLVPKPSISEKGQFNDHPSVKPLSLCQHLIRLSTFPDAIVLDPFVGSGTTAVAALACGRHFIGIDINPRYIEIARRRIALGVNGSLIKESPGEWCWTPEGQMTNDYRTNRAKASPKRSPAKR